MLNLFELIIKDMSSVTYTLNYKLYKITWHNCFIFVKNI